MMELWKSERLFKDKKVASQANIEYYLITL
jgi:hypothetical protein